MNGPLSAELKFRENIALLLLLLLLLLFVLEALGQEECHVTLRMLILTSQLFKEPFNRTIDVFPYY